MYTNGSCTLFLRSNGYTPIYIEKCFIVHRKIHTSEKSGLHYKESAFAMFEENQLEIPVTWTEGKDFLIEGIVDVAAESYTEQKMAETMKRLKEAGAYTVMIADHKEYGSKEMRHWELSCA